jgi:4-amino-4-deoxy-L-arabinose transferase-like glycosyltransferase
MTLQRARALRLTLFGPSEHEQRFAPGRWTCMAVLACIVVLAGVLRVQRLGDLPPGFFCDEAGLGYNAYSILETGKDENGVFLPLFVWSFDTSYKNPIFIYSAVAPVAVFGPSEFAVRLTSAVYGTATVLMIFFLGRALMGPWVGLLAAALLAVCPWHLHFSRIAFELIAFPFFFVAGVTCLVSYTRGRRLLPLAAVLLGVCLYTYAIAKLFVPLFLAGFVVFFFGTLRRRRRESLLALALLAATAMPVVLFDLTHTGRAGQYFSENTILEPGQPVQEVARRFFDNYKEFLSTEFLFVQGDWIRRHAVRNHGELYPFFAPLLFLGLVVAACRNDRAMRLPLWWLLLYPVAPALMSEIPSASRGFIGAPAFCLLAAIGAGGLLRLPAQWSERRLLVSGAQTLLVAAGAAFLAPQVSHYWTLYTHEYPTYAAKDYRGFQFGHREIVRYFLAHREEYDHMMVTVRDNNQPQIFLLFYSAYAPARLHTSGREGFEEQSRMSVIDTDRFFLYPRQEKILLAATLPEIPLFEDYQVKHTVVAPDGTPAFLLIEPGPIKDFVRSWWVAGPYPVDDTSPPPKFDPAHLRRGAPGGRSWHPNDPGHASVDMNKVLVPEETQNCAWATNVFFSDVARTVRVFAGFDSIGEVWINGEPVALNHLQQKIELVPDSWAGTAFLEKGDNAVAIRNCGPWYAWRFYFRLTEPDGSRLSHAWWEY